jgi:hypothetical protein
MPRAIVKNGVIYPLEPLPPDWVDGSEVRVEVAKESEDRTEEIDRWYEELQALATQLDPEDDEQFVDAIANVRRKAKDEARRKMGLP